MSLKPAAANETLKDKPTTTKGPVSYDTVIAMRVELRGIRAKLRSMMGKVGELDEEIKEFEEKFRTMHDKGEGK